MNNKQYWKVRTLISYTKKYDLSEIEIIPASLIWDKIRQVYPPKNFLSPISLKVREIIVLVNLF